MAQQWFIQREGKPEAGPFSVEQIRKLAARGELKPGDRVRREGSSNWAHARQLKGIFPAAPPPADPPPAADSNPFSFDDQLAPKAKSGERKPSSGTHRAADERKPWERERERERDDERRPQDRECDAPPSDDESPFSFDGTNAEERPAKKKAPEPPPDGAFDFDMEEPSPRAAKPRRDADPLSLDEDEDDRPHRKRRDEDDADADDRKPRRRDEDSRHRDDEEDDTPRPKRRRDDEDDEKDDKGGGFLSRLGGKIKQTVGDLKKKPRDDEDEDDTPRSRRRNEDDDERPRSRREDDEDDRPPRRDERRKEPPALKERPGLRLRKTGEVDPHEFTRCWNALEDVGLNTAELVAFCCTRSIYGGTLGSKIAGFFAGKKGSKPLYHLAVCRTEVALLYAPAEGDVQAVRLPLVALTWQFVNAADAPKGMMAKAAGLFRKPTEDEAEDEERTLLLALKTADAEHTLRLFRGGEAGQMREALTGLVLEHARALIKEGRFVLAERYLDKVAEGEKAAKEAARLRAELGVLDTVLVDYQQGLPDLAGPARGVLRLDSRGLEFFVEQTGASVRIEAGRITGIGGPRKGKFPTEYAKRVQAERQAARRAIGTAQATARLNAAMRLLAARNIAAAKQRLLNAKFGSPLLNRLVVAAAVGGRPVSLIFDVAGTERDLAEQEAAAFGALLASIAGADLPAAEEPGPRPRLIGCPRCRAKLRAKQPGVVGCPRCLAKVRVPETAPRARA
jgi:hypothetical protein